LEKESKIKIPELVVPAGTMEKLKIAVDYGADAVYLSEKRFGLRHYAGNFDLNGLEKAVDYVKRNGKKLYLAVNVFCRNSHIKELKNLFRDISSLGINALIISDPGAVKIAREQVPHIPIHLSTQSNTTNLESVKFWADNGIKRVVLARELSSDEIHEITADSGIEVEIFVHGALCISYSGRCYLSAYLEQRESNLGMCSQPCRRQYYLMEKESDKYIPIELEPDATYLFNPKDLCLIDYLPRIVEMGVDAVKVEGRMKTAYYVACVTRIYREALDLLKSDNEKYNEYLPLWRKELEKISNRDYTCGFFAGTLPENIVKKEGKYIQNYKFLGIIDKNEGCEFIIDPKSTIQTNDDIEVIGPFRKNDRNVKILEILRDGMKVDCAHPNQIVMVRTDSTVKAGEILRKPIKEGE